MLFEGVNEMYSLIHTIHFLTSALAHSYVTLTYPVSLLCSLLISVLTGTLWEMGGQEVSVFAMWAVPPQTFPSCFPGGSGREWLSADLFVNEDSARRQREAGGR